MSNNTLLLFGWVCGCYMYALMHGKRAIELGLFSIHEITRSRAPLINTCITGNKNRTNEIWFPVKV